MNISYTVKMRHLSEVYIPRDCDHRFTMADNDRCQRLRAEFMLLGAQSAWSVDSRVFQSLADPVTSDWEIARR